jgi:hypothetical protein
MRRGIRHIVLTAVLSALCLALMGTPAIHVGDDEQAPATPARTAPVSVDRPAALVPLYISFAALQALDVDSTYRVLGQGGREANPLAATFVRNPPALIALKAATAAGAIAIAERVRKHSPKAAMLLMIGLNSAMATVVAHNYAVASRIPNRIPNP